MTHLFSIFIGILVIIDLSGLEEFEPAVILGILYGIKKEVSLNNGELKLCSLDPKIVFYFKENRLDRLWLEDKFRFDIGNFVLEVIHTPGHTSGSICIFEFNHKLLFTGDTVFADGTLSYISESGSIGDYINSIGRLGIISANEVYPGHGAISKKPEEDMQTAILNAEQLLKDEMTVEIGHETLPAEL